MMLIYDLMSRTRECPGCDLNLFQGNMTHLDFISLSHITHLQIFACPLGVINNN